MTHLPGGEAIPPYPGYHSPHPHTGYSPHLGLPSDLSHSYTNFGTTAMGLTPATPTTHTTASPSSSNPSGAPAAPGPAYKMEPGDPGVYPVPVYPGAGAGPGGVSMYSALVTVPRQIRPFKYKISFRILRIFKEFIDKI